MQGLLRRRGIPLWPCTPTATRSSSTSRNISPPARPPSSDGQWRNWGIQLIFAISPQAKGRVERTAGTFQDRRITELRLAGATTLEAGQGRVEAWFLPRFDRRFGVPTQCHRAGIPAFAAGPPPLEQVLCFKHRRRRGQGQHREVPEAHPASCFPIQRAAAKPEGRLVEVLEGLDGRLSVYTMRDASSPASQEAPPIPASLRNRNMELPQPPQACPTGPILGSRQNLRLEISNC